MNNSTKIPLNYSSPACSAVVSTTFTVTLSVISAAAFIGNALVATTFIKTRRLRTSTNYYIVNMAVSDLLCPIFNWPLYASEGMLTPEVLISEPWASPVCKLGMYFRAVSQAVSILSLMLIALDRFVAIVYPLKVIMLNVKVRVILLSMSWVIPILFGLPYALYATVIKVERYTFCRFLMSDESLTVFNAAGFVVFYIVPLITITVLYSEVLRTLKTRPLPGELLNDQKTEKRRQQNRRILKILISIVFAFFVCWTPLCIYLFLKKFYPALFPTDKCLFLVGFTFYVFPSVSTAINPVILFVFSTNYNQALKTLLSPIITLCKLPDFTKGRHKRAETIATLEVNLVMTDTKLLD